MDPKNVRAILNTIGVVLSTLSAIVVALQKVDLTSATAVIGAVGLAIGLAFGKASEAPGGVPKWKIPEHLRQFIPK